MKYLNKVCHYGKRWNKKKTSRQHFAYDVAFNIVKESKDLEPKSVEKCVHKTN